MQPSRRPFAGGGDFAGVYDFLVGLYRPENRDGNWFGPIWEYAWTHPWFDHGAAGHIGLWEDDGRIVGLATYELRLGEAFFALAPGYEALRAELLDHAEPVLGDPDDGGRLIVFVPDFDEEFAGLVRSRGYVREPCADRPMSRFRIPEPFPAIPLAEGYRLRSLADENDLRKVHRVLHRGFDHPGEPPEDELDGRRLMQSGPHFRPELTSIVVGPDGEFAAYCGMWYDAANRIGYVEPVCCDPCHRRRGLGSAAVLDGIRRCAEAGATVAYVGTDLPFYRGLGFEVLYTTAAWRHTPACQPTKV